MRDVFILFLSFICYINQTEALAERSICLNMIVKDESAVITRCLASAKPLIDYWVIVDTGSTDGTQKIIKDFMQDIPGELHERPWINFAHNRNEALELAKNHADYILFIDADDVFAFPKKFKLPPLTKDGYYLPIEYGGTIYNRIQLVKSALNWKWIGVVHEAISSTEARSYDVLSDVKIVISNDGSRSQDTKKFQKDAELLEKALLEDPHNSRNVFYLAQSYRDAQDPEQALKNYEKRVKMGGWNEEVFYSLLQIGLLQEALGMNLKKIVASYEKAYTYRPSRIEPLYRLANLYRREENYLAGYQTALRGLDQRDSTDGLFVEKWIYDYGLLFEFSICAYWVDKYTESLLASQALLANPKLPVEIRESVQRNLKWVQEKFAESKHHSKALYPLLKN